MTVDLLPEPPSVPADIDDDFGGPALRRDVWVDHYLPHWTTPDRSEARYDLRDDGLRLRIDADQPDWRPEDAPLRVSNLQTGAFSGAVGSIVGIHRHRPDGLTVRTATPLRLLWAPRAGRVDITVTPSTAPGTMLAAWLVGTEHHSPDDAGEICVFEIDADAVGTETTVARSGIKAHGDPRLSSDMTEVRVPTGVGARATWTAIWGRGETVIGCDGVVVRRLTQAPGYPLILLIDLFETAPPAGDYPKTALVHRVRGWNG
jgi:hypothetical protein